MGAKLLRASWGLEGALVSLRQCEKDRDLQSWQKPPAEGLVLQPHHPPAPKPAWSPPCSHLGACLIGSAPSTLKLPILGHPTINLLAPAGLGQGHSQKSNRKYLQRVSAGMQLPWWAQGCWHLSLWHPTVSSQVGPPCGTAPAPGGYRLVM